MLRTLKQIANVGIVTESTPLSSVALKDYTHLQKKIHAVFGRALGVRHVDAGSCNGCELEIHALNNPYYNLEGLGIRFVASPRHADLLLVTGPVSHNMQDALWQTYEAMPAPKWVVAVGACGVDGGIFGCSYASSGAVDTGIPVDARVTGCPPQPEAILQGILAALALTIRHTD